MSAHELIGIQIRQHVAIENEKRLIELLRSNDSGPMVSSGSISWVQLIRMFH